MNPSTTALSLLLWRAQCGSRQARTELSADPRISGEDREFWKYKSEGGTAFSPLSLPYQTYMSQRAGETQ